MVSLDMVLIGNEGPQCTKARGLQTARAFAKEMLLADSERDREGLGRVADGHGTRHARAARGRVGGGDGVAGSVQDWTHGGS